MDSKKLIEIYNKIGLILFEVIPENALKIRAECRLGDDFCSVKIIFTKSDGTDGWYNIGEISSDYASKISEFMMELRCNMKNEKGAWSQCVYSITKEGKFTMNFKYNDDD